jgi:hypothetical protein
VDISDADGPDDILGTADDGLALGAGSPCIDAGDGSSAPADDILGVTRFDHNSNGGAGTAPYPDMGAYEFTGP